MHLRIQDDVSDRLRCHYLVDTIPPAPVLRLASNESTDGTEVALVAQEVGLLLALGPETDGVGECVHRLAVAPYEGSSKVNMLDLVLFRLQVGNLTNVIALLKSQ